MVLVGTGTYQAWRCVGTLSALAGSAYGTLLVFKLAAVGLVLWLGAISRSVVRRRYLTPAPLAEEIVAAPAPATVPASRAGRAGPTRTATRTVRRADRAQRELELLARRRLRQSVRAEAVIAVAILGITSVLVATPPANRPDAASPAAAGPAVAAPGVTVDLPLADNGALHVRLDPARAGATTLTLSVRDSAGAPWDVPEVSAAFLLADRGIGPLAVVLRKDSAGAYESEGLTLPLPGTWQLQVRVRTSDFEQTPVQTELTIA